MNRAEMLAGYLDVLDEINQATRIALETLSDNAATVRMIIDEIMNGAQEYPTHPSIPFEVQHLFEEPAPSSAYIGDDINELADQIVAKIKEGENNPFPGIRTVDITFDRNKFSPEELMETVQRKMAGKKKEEKIQEDINDDFDFKNQLE